MSTDSLYVGINIPTVGSNPAESFSGFDIWNDQLLMTNKIPLNTTNMVANKKIVEDSIESPDSMLKWE
jgi:hypothetical protein